MKSRQKSQIYRDQDADRTLPEIALTKEGKEYQPADTVWRLHDGGIRITLNYGQYQQYCTGRLIGSLRSYMVHLLRGQALHSCWNFFTRLLYLVKHAHRVRGGGLVDVITADDVVSYRGTLTKEREFRLHGIRKRVREWVQLGYFGIEAEASRTLDALKLKKNASGTAVLTHDPINGPFNDEEFQAIIEYLLNSYARGEIALSDLALAFMFMAFGPRPVTFAALRVKDFQVDKDRNGIERYSIALPAAKRRQGGRRTNFLERKLTREYGQMLQLLVGQVKKRFADQIAAGFDPLELPIFPSDDASVGYATSSRELYWKLTDCFAAGEPIICKRKGFEETPLKVFPKRFRQTVGTRMAEEGKREREIAMALGHTTTTSARVYIEATGKIRHSINEKLAQELEPIARYFLGEIIESEAEAVRGSDPSSRIRSFEGGLKGKVLGNCGKTGFCGGFVPLPCYKCRNFQPWLDAPHEEVLAWLLHDRQNKYDLTGDETIATVNDEVIKSVFDVARRCQILRGSAGQKVIDS